MDINLVLLHEQMLNKQGHEIVTSLTLNDIQDLARCCKTYGVNNLFIAHPSDALQRLANRLITHWMKGYGSTYNPNRKDAISIVEVVSTLENAIENLTQRAGMAPRLIGTSARDGSNRVSFSEMRSILKQDSSPYLLMLGTGWGMTDSLLGRADIILPPIKGPTNFNHLSVRSAGAIILDRLLGIQDMNGGQGSS